MEHKQHYVGIFAMETDELIEEIKAGTNERAAERIERGVNINLDHANYYTDWYTKDGEDA